MSELEARFRVSLTGKDELEQFFERSARGATSFRSKMTAALEATNRQIVSFASSAAKALGSLAGIGGGIGFAAQAKGVIELRDAIVGLAAAANDPKLATAEGLEGLRKQILDTAVATNQLGSDLTEALQAFTAKTGDIETGRKNLELYARTATATRAAVSEIANIGADLAKLGINGNQSNALAILAKQADVGAVELKDLVSQGPRILAAAAGANVRGEGGLRNIGALAQVYQKGTGNVERTSTAIEATFRDIAMKAPAIEGVLGVKGVFSRDRTDVLQDIIRKTGGEEKILRKIFGDEAFRGVNVMAEEYRRTKGFGTFGTFRDVAADASIIDSKFALNTSSGLAKLKRSQIEMERSSDANFGDLAEGTAKRSGLVAGAYDWVTAHPMAAGAGVVGAMALRNLVGGMLGGGGSSGPGSALGSLVGMGKGAPVFVTNWPGSMGGGEGGGLGGLAGSADKAAKGLGVFQMAIKNAGLLVASFGAGFAAGEWIDSKLNLSDKLADTLFEFLHPEEAKEKADAARKREQALIEKSRRNGHRLVNVEDVNVLGAYGGEVGPTMQNGNFYTPMKVMETPPDWWKDGISVHVTFDENGNPIAKQEKGTRSPKAMKRRVAEGR